MHIEAFRWIEFVLRDLPIPRVVVEFGSRNINGSVRPLLPRVAYVGVDLASGDGVDVVADAADYRPAVHPDLVVCAETLEHTPRAAEVVANAITVAAPDGHVIVTCAAPGRAQHSGIDGGALKPGEWYRNVTADELRAWVTAAGGTVLRVEQYPARGDIYLLARAS